MMISQSNSLFFWILGFGVLTGLGLGFGYASATLIGFLRNQPVDVYVGTRIK